MLDVTVVRPGQKRYSVFISKTNIEILTQASKFALGLTCPILLTLIKSVSSQCYHTREIHFTLDCLLPVVPPVSGNNGQTQSIPLYYYQLQQNQRLLYWFDEGRMGGKSFRCLGKYFNISFKYEN